MKLSELAVLVTDAAIANEQACQCPDHVSGKSPRLTDEQIAALKLVFSQKPTFNLGMAIVARIIAVDVNSSITFAQDVLEAKQAIIEGLMEAQEEQDGIPEPQGNA